MSDTVSIYHATPKELVIVQVEVDGDVVSSGYTLCFKPAGEQPDSSDPGWQAPDTAGDDTGLFVGTATNNTMTINTYYQPWYFLDSPGPEEIIKAADTQVFAY